MFHVITKHAVLEQNLTVSAMVRADGTTVDAASSALKYSDVTATIGNTTVTIPTISVSIRANRSTAFAIGSPGPSFHLKDDLWYISENAAMVIARTTQAMSFSSYEEMAKTVAETQLRILEFRTPCLDIQGIRVKILRSRNLGATTVDADVLAHWSSDDNHQDPLTRKVNFSVEESAAEADAAEHVVETEDAESCGPYDTTDLVRKVSSDKDSDAHAYSPGPIQLQSVSKDQHLQFRSPNLQ